MREIATTVIFGLLAATAASARADAKEDLEDAEHDISTLASDLYQMHQWAGGGTPDNRSVPKCHERVGLLRKGGVKTIKGMWYERGKKVDSNKYEITLAQADELCDEYGQWVVVREQSRA